MQGKLPKAQTQHVVSPVAGNPSSIWARHATSCGKEQGQLCDRAAVEVCTLPPAHWPVQCDWCYTPDRGKQCAAA